MFRSLRRGVVRNGYLVSTLGQLTDSCSDLFLSGGDRAAPGACNDDALGTPLDGVRDEAAVKLAMGEEDVYFWERRVALVVADRLQIERVPVHGQAGRVEEVRHVVEELAEAPAGRLPKAVGERGHRLGRPEGLQDAVREGEEHTAASAGRAGGQGDALEEVGVAVGGQRRDGPGGTGGDDGLAAVDEEVEEHGRLFEGVGPVGEDGAVDVAVVGAEGVVEEARHVHGESVGSTGRGAGPAGRPVRNGQLGDVEQVRVSCDDVLGSDAVLAVLGVVKGAVTGALGEGAAGEQNPSCVSLVSKSRQHRVE